MKTNIVSTNYIDGNRVVNKTVTYDKSDDLFALANLQRQLEQTQLQLSDAQTATAVEQLTERVARLTEEVAGAKAIVAGYDAT